MRICFWFLIFNIWFKRPIINIFSPSTIKSLLQKYSAAPLKRLGQNFLINAGVLEKIIQAANLDRGETVLEIGPGIGTLTQELAKQAKKVVAVEKDKKMVEILKETLRDYKNVEVIQGDILKIPITKKQIPNKFQIPNIEILKNNSPHPSLYKREEAPPLILRGGWGELKYKLIANLPYYITSPVIRKFLEAENKPKEMILMVQKEVAQRICAMPPEMSLLAVSVQFYSNPKILSFVSKGSFWPQPKVDSAILKIVPYPKQNRLPLSKRGIKGDLSQARKILPNPPFTKEGANEFFQIVRAGFSAPRKQLAGNLSKKLRIDKASVVSVLKKADIDPAQRAETLSVEDWIKLVHFLNQK